MCWNNQEMLTYTSCDADLCLWRNEDESHQHQISSTSGMFIDSRGCQMYCVSHHVAYEDGEFPKTL